MKHLFALMPALGQRLCLGLLLAVLAGCERPVLTDQQGDKLPWDSLRGQWVAVNYWAEWCAPCLAEIPELNRLDQDPDVVVLGVNFDGVSADDLRRLSSKMGIHYRVLGSDPGPVLGWQPPLALPATFMIDPDGQLVEARFGEQTRADLRSLVDDKVAR